MLGWHSLFISCTSRSMLALLLASVFIFSAMTCPVILCCTWYRERESQRQRMIVCSQTNSVNVSPPLLQQSLPQNLKL